MFEMLNKIPDTKNGRRGWQEKQTNMKRILHRTHRRSALSARKLKPPIIQQVHDISLILRSPGTPFPAPRTQHTVIGVMGSIPRVLKPDSP